MSFNTFCLYSEHKLPQAHADITQKCSPRFSQPTSKAQFHTTSSTSLGCSKQEWWKQEWWTAQCAARGHKSDNSIWWHKKWSDWKYDIYETDSFKGKVCEDFYLIVWIFKKIICFVWILLFYNNCFFFFFLNIWCYF